MSILNTCIFSLESVKNSNNKFSGMAKLSATSILMFLEKNVWDNWEQSPVDGAVWKAEWREGGIPSLTTLAAGDGQRTIWWM